MKIVTFLLLLVASTAFAQTADLSPSVSVTVPTATKLQLTGRYENFVERYMTVYFRWIDASGKPIYAPGKAGKFDNSWTCADDSDAVPAKTCFTDIYGFAIRTQDVGVTLGRGTRNLIIAKMKQEIPQLSGVTVTFGD